MLEPTEAVGTIGSKITILVREISIKYLTSGEHVHLQLILPSDHPTLEPRHFLDERVVNEHQQDFMFLECIKFINEVGLFGLFLTA